MGQASLGYEMALGSHSLGHFLRLGKEVSRNGRFEEMGAKCVHVIYAVDPRSAWEYVLSHSRAKQGDAISHSTLDASASNLDHNHDYRRVHSLLHRPQRPTPLG